MREKVAVVGMSCRFPGIRNPDEMWDVLVRGRDTLVDYQPGYDEKQRMLHTQEIIRWPARIGRIAQPDIFDAAFFGISPREARVIDPQQRQLLEVSYEAISDAGWALDMLAGTRTGVYIGQWTDDYFDQMKRERVPQNLHTTIGGGRFSSSGRIAHAYDLRGPALTIDTHCSSSLVALHYAAKSLQYEECEMALAGGVNLIFDTTINEAYQRSGLLSGDGRCKFGDDAADGYVRSEGVAVVALKLLDRAVADGDPVYAVLLETAVRHHGRAGELFVKPCVEGQVELLRAAYQRAGISHRDVSYVEAHGTGTRVGDPVELAALSAVLGDGRTKHEGLRVGSVKSNIGHCEATAGLAGLIKVVLSLGKGELPRTVNVDTPRKEIDWNTSPVQLQLRHETWPEGRPRVAAVNSFGISGTNAHAILEAYDGPEPPSRTDKRGYVLPASAATNESLESYLEVLAEYLAGTPEHVLHGICHTAGARRTHLKHRAAFVGDSLENLQRAIQSYTHDSQYTLANPPRVAFVCCGQGEQTREMAAELLRTEPGFAKVIHEVSLRFEELAQWSIYDVLAGLDCRRDLRDTDVAQPCIFALQVGLARLLASWGVKAHAIVGHSVGEVAAAHLAGILDLDDAITLLYHRSQVMQRATSLGGAMGVVGLDRSACLELVEASGEVCLAAHNGPQSCVVAGSRAAVDKLLQQAAALDVFARALEVDYAFHSRMMAPYAALLPQKIARLHPCNGSVSMYSTVFGRRVSGTELDPSYWEANVRQTVHFHAAMKSMLADGFNLYIELSPRSVLTQHVRASARAAGQRVLAIGTLKRGRGGSWAMRACVAKVFRAGGSVNFRAVNREGPCVHLPAYTWHGQSYWFRDRSTPAESRVHPTATHGEAGEPMGERDVATRHKVLRMIGDTLEIPFTEIDVEIPLTKLGLDSLMATQLRGALAEETGYTPTLVELLRGGTAKWLVRQVESQRCIQTEGEAEGDRNATVAEPSPMFPLSWNQRALWFVQQANPDDPAYHVAWAVKIVEQVDLAALDAALRGLVRKHEILRVRVDWHDGELMQIVCPEPVVGLEHEHTIAELGLEGAIQAFVRRRFDFARGPLLRLAALPTPEGSTVVVFCAHHLIMDGASLCQTFQELLLGYAQQVGRATQSVETYTSSYRAFVDWQSQKIGKTLAKTRRFWADRLSGVQDIEIAREVGIDLPEPSASTYRFFVSPALRTRLAEQAWCEGVTINSILLCAFRRLLTEAAGRTPMVAVIASGRTTTKFRDVVGDFVNPVLVPPWDEAEGLTFGEMVHATAEKLAQSLEHQDIPLAKIVDLLGTSFARGASPFRYVFLYQQFRDPNFAQVFAPPAGCGQIEIGGVQVEPLHVPQQENQVDLTLEVVESGDHLVCSFKYRGSLFSHETVCRWASRFVEYVASVVVKSEWSKRLPPLHEPDRSASCNVDTGESSGTVDAQIRRVAANRPADLAVQMSTVQITYGCLDERADAVAWALHQRGLSPGERVVVLVERDPWMIVGLIGILRAGGVYVPVDAEYPTGRIVQIIEGSQPSVIMTNRNDLIPTVAKASVLTLQEIPLLPEAGSRLPQVDLQEPAYCIFTSGSTGQPKGALISHRALANHMQWMNGEFAFAAQDRFLQRTSISFDASVWELFAPLMVGAVCILPPPRVQRNPQELCTLIRTSGITVLQAVPTLLDMFVHADSLRDCSGLRLLFSGGERLTKALVDDLHAALPTTEVVNLYGPTEATIDSLFWRVPRPLSGEPPIGRPIEHMGCWVVDEAGQPVAVGTTGELWLYGVGLGMGYLGRPDLTAERFLEMQRDDSSIRVYRTGDLVRMRNDGAVEFVGRVDRQVKLRGHRIELGEIEAVLAQLPGLHHPTVILHGKGSHQRIVAYCEASEDATLSTSRMHRFVAQQLPEYMIPSQLVIVPEIPQLPNGKVDRDALPEPSLDTVRRRAPESVSELEHQMCRIWSRVLGIRVERTDAGFFELGGNSLLLVMLQQQLVHELGVDVRLSTLLMHPTIGGFVAELRRRKRTRPQSESRAAKPNTVRRAALAALAKRAHRH